MARLSKELVKIVCDLKLRFSADEVGYRLRYTPEIETFLNKVGFRSWQTKLAEFKDPSDKASLLPQREAAKTVERWTLAEFKVALATEAAVAVAPVCDDELDQHRCWRSVAVATSKAVGLIDLNPDNAKTFISILNEARPLVVCYQSKPILQLALVSGVTPEFKYFDLAQAHFILNPEFRHDLDTITEEFLGFKLEAPSQGQGDLFGNDDGAELTHHGSKAEAILKLYPILRAKMQEMNAERAYDDLDIPLINVLAEIELEGVFLDTKFYKELEQEFTTQITAIEADVYAVAETTVNLRSPKQIGELLFEKLQLPVIRRTKTGYSTDAEVLTELVAMKLNPIPELLLKYREIEKLLSTYVKALPSMISATTGKIHTHFQPSNAATGRLSSDNPNLQNIPVRTENGRKLRRGFVPSPGRVLLSADYSQVELRLLAHFSQDRHMLEAFQHDRDIHRQTASEIFDVPLEQVTKEMRNSAKAINFGLMYGQTSFGLSQTLHISQGEAKKYITNYFQKFQSVKSYLDGLKERAEATGYAETLFGRKRLLPDIKSTNRQVKAMAERVAINSPIQGTAADIIKLAMINIQRLLAERKFKSRMILQVHDELIFDVEPAELEDLKVLVKEQMEGAVTLSVELKVEMGTGANWYDLK
jgi:DNA polymerase-1